VRKSIRISIIAGILGLLIAGFFISRFLIEKKDEKSVSEEKEIIRITDIPEGELKKIILTNSSGELVLAEKEGSWAVEPAPDFEITATEPADIERNFRTLTAERVIEENPESYADYGLDRPRGTALGIMEDNSEILIEIGNQIPSKRGYYVRKKGDTGVYSVSSYKASSLLSSIDDLRQKRLTHIDKEQITYLYIKDEKEIEILPRNAGDSIFIAPFSAFVMTKPYMQKRGVDEEKFSAFIETLPFSFTVSKFIDDPGDLSQYGLDAPEKEFILEDAERRLHVLIGDEAEDGEIFCREADSQEVFTLNKRDLDFLSVKSFEITDKFALIINIDDVDRFILTRGEEKYTAEIRRTPPEDEESEPLENYYVNGREIEEKPFKAYYQKVIGLILDAENPEPGKADGESDVLIEYYLNTEPKYASLSFQPFNRDFYKAVRGSDSVTEFLVSIWQVDDAVEAARNVLKDKEE